MRENVRFKDKVIIVTGGARGIGKSTAEGFANEGGIVLILDKLEEEGNNTVKGIESKGGNAVLMKIDATDPQQVKDNVKKIMEQWGRIDILVNNIGGHKPKLFLESDEELWRTILDINILVTMRFCRAVLPHMVKQHYGRVINLASVSGLYAWPGSVTYGIAKAGIISLTKSLAAAMAPHNIRINCVAPCKVLSTGLAQEHARLNPWYAEITAKGMLLERPAEPEEVANAIMFLTSDESSYILGQCLAVDNGYHLL